MCVLVSFFFSLPLILHLSCLRPSSAGTLHCVASSWCTSRLQKTLSPQALSIFVKCGRLSSDLRLSLRRCVLNIHSVLCIPCPSFALPTDILYSFACVFLKALSLTSIIYAELNNVSNFPFLAVLASWSSARIRPANWRVCRDLFSPLFFLTLPFFFSLSSCSCIMFFCVLWLQSDSSFVHIYHLYISIKNISYHFKAKYWIFTYSPCLVPQPLHIGLPRPLIPAACR